MSDLGQTLPVPIDQTVETKEMRMKWLQAAKQERISRIAHLKQSVEDLLKGKIPEIERQILYSQQELANLEKAEQRLAGSVDA